jgi:hypothetical protein
MDEELSQHLEELRQIHLRRLHEFEKQAATFGASTPPEITIEIENIKSKLSRLHITESQVSSGLHLLESRGAEQRLDILFENAYTIDIAGMSLASIARQYVDLLYRKASQGCVVRLLLLNPENFCLMLTASSFLTRETPDGQANEIRDSLQKLSDDPLFGQTFQVKLSNYPLAHGLLIINGRVPDAKMRVEMYMHSMRPNWTPGFWLHRKDKDNKWFDNFYEEFNILWEKASPYSPSVR